MDIRIYVGAHKTASQHLSSILVANTELLDAEETVFYSRSFRALKFLNRALKAINSGGDKEDITGEMLHSFSEGRDMKRLLIINPDIVGAVTKPFGKELFYPRTSGLIRQIQTLFEGHSLNLYAGVRNPATFLPSCYAETMLSASFTDYQSYLEKVNLLNLKWSPFLHRLQGKQSDIPLTVWRFEDYPYIWRDIAQAFTGLPNGQNLTGNSERVNSSITLRGAQLLNRYTQEHPPRTKQDFENTKLAFMERFPSSPNEIVAPKWPPETVQNLTHNYEDDWYYIERMEGINIIQPREF
jgi:hypothetical protein